MDIGMLFSGALVSGAIYDVIKGGTIITGKWLLDNVLQNMRDDINGVLADKIAQRINQLGLLANETKAEFANRVKNDEQLHQLLTSTVYYQHADNTQGVGINNGQIVNPVFNYGSTPEKKS